VCGFPSVIGSSENARRQPRQPSKAEESGDKDTTRQIFPRSRPSQIDPMALKPGFEVAALAPTPSRYLLSLRNDRASSVSHVVARAYQQFPQHRRSPESARTGVMSHPHPRGVTLTLGRRHHAKSQSQIPSSHPQFHNGAATPRGTTPRPGNRMRSIRALSPMRPLIPHPQIAIGRSARKNFYIKFLDPDWSARSQTVKWRTRSPGLTMIDGRIR
jgi:hypothetical protein